MQRVAEVDTVDMTTPNMTFWCEGWHVQVRSVEPISLWSGVRDTLAKVQDRLRTCLQRTRAEPSQVR